MGDNIYPSWPSRYAVKCAKSWTSNSVRGFDNYIGMQYISIRVNGKPCPQSCTFAQSTPKDKLWGDGAVSSLRLNTASLLIDRFKLCLLSLIALKIPNRTVASETLDTAILFMEILQPDLTHTIRKEVDPLEWAELLGSIGGTWGELEVRQQFVVSRVTLMWFRSKGKW